MNKVNFIELESNWIKIVHEWNGGFCFLCLPIKYLSLCNSFPFKKIQIDFLIYDTDLDWM